MSHASSILGGLLRTHGIPFEDFISPLETAFRLSRGKEERFRSSRRLPNGDIDMPRGFRSVLKPPSIAGSVQRDAEQIALPDDLPYVAGFYTGGNVRLTAVALGDDAIWYGAQTDASVVLRGMTLPAVLVDGMRGRPVDAVVGHPALVDCGETVISANQNDGNLVLRLTNTMVPMERAETALSRLERSMREDRAARPRRAA